MRIFLIMTDGSQKEFDEIDSMRSFVSTIHRNDVDVIVFGEVKDDKVLWEKQFKSVTVMPTSFGKRT